jgi:hypothetical protein
MNRSKTPQRFCWVDDVTVSQPGLQPSTRYISVKSYINEVLNRDMNVFLELVSFTDRVRCSDRNFAISMSYYAFSPPKSANPD